MKKIYLSLLGLSSVYFSSQNSLVAADGVQINSNQNIINLTANNSITTYVMDKNDFTNLNNITLNTYGNFGVMYFDEFWHAGDATFTSIGGNAKLDSMFIATNINVNINANLNTRYLLINEGNLSTIAHFSVEDYKSGNTAIINVKQKGKVTYNPVNVVNPQYFNRVDLYDNGSFEILSGKASTHIGTINATGMNNIFLQNTGGATINKIDNINFSGISSKRIEFLDGSFGNFYVVNFNAIDARRVEIYGPGANNALLTVENMNANNGHIYLDRAGLHFKNGTIGYLYTYSTTSIGSEGGKINNLEVRMSTLTLNPTNVNRTKDEYLEIDNALITNSTIQYLGRTDGYTPKNWIGAYMGNADVWGGTFILESNNARMKMENVTFHNTNTIQANKNSNFYIGTAKLERDAKINANVSNGAYVEFGNIAYNYYNTLDFNINSAGHIKIIDTSSKNLNGTTNINIVLNDFGFLTTGYDIYGHKGNVELSSVKVNDQASWVHIYGNAKVDTYYSNANTMIEAGVLSTGNFVQNQNGYQNVIIRLEGNKNSNAYGADGFVQRADIGKNTMVSGLKSSGTVTLDQSQIKVDVNYINTANFGAESTVKYATVIAADNLNITTSCGCAPNSLDINVSLANDYNKTFAYNFAEVVNGQLLVIQVERLRDVGTALRVEAAEEGITLSNRSMAVADELDAIRKNNLDTEGNSTLSMEDQYRLSSAERLFNVNTNAFIRLAQAERFVDNKVLHTLAHGSYNQVKSTYFASKPQQTEGFDMFANVIGSKGDMKDTTDMSELKHDDVGVVLGGSYNGVSVGLYTYKVDYKNNNADLFTYKGDINSYGIIADYTFILPQEVNTTVYGSYGFGKAKTNRESIMGNSEGKSDISETSIGLNVNKTFNIGEVKLTPKIYYSYSIVDNKGYKEDGMMAYDVSGSKTNINEIGIGVGGAYLSKISEDHAIEYKAGVDVIEEMRRGENTKATMAGVEDVSENAKNINGVNFAGSLGIGYNYKNKVTTELSYKAEMNGGKDKYTNQGIALKVTGKL